MTPLRDPVNNTTSGTSPLHLAKSLTIALSITTALVAPAIAQNTHAKNVILLISDGAGMQTWNAASYYRHGGLGHEVYDDFEVKLFASTHPLSSSKEPTKSK